MIATSATRLYIPAFDFRLDRYACIPMGNFIFNSEGAPGSGKTEETFSSPDGVSRDALKNSLRLMEEAIAGARK
jgi:hypothetical protein